MVAITSGKPGSSQCGAATKQFDLLRADIPLGFLKSSAQRTIQSLVSASPSYSSCLDLLTAGLEARAGEESSKRGEHRGGERDA